ncbi:acetate/propionate family kinase [Limibaculum sp. FT325]|uniref:acetate/propionate family kinase n=1 Tax=Thermohalobaculum sediminis TaxID=2939436 RepID=UPI0020BEBD42|nr:acetate/propionate family kinase [Limibaculum sediminis]MCL5778252.1 acetate/propionate family kinase [Limibaculum sediminis]
MAAQREGATDGMRPGLLVVNAGSSSIKFAMFDAGEGDRPHLSGLAERIGSADARVTARDGEGRAVGLPDLPAGTGASHETLIRWLLPALAPLAGGPVVASGHRIVHGGAGFTAPALIGAAEIDALERLVPLARTHQPHAIAALRAVGAVWPDLPRVGCFDTAFHATMPAVARSFPLPRRITDAGVRRYGFHGLSYAWIAGCLPAHLGPRADGRVIIAHLGNGASLCGMVGCRSRATTMGFTPLDGLMMGERPGALDPGILLFLLEEMKLDVADLRRILFRESGLLGVSGLSNDMRTLLASGDPAARLAVDLYVYRAVREIGGVAAEIGGCDAIVFTAGVGENAAPIRARIAQGCGWLGAAIDAQANMAAVGGREARCISAPGSRVALWVVPTNEEAVIARATRGFAGQARA